LISGVLVEFPQRIDDRGLASILTLDVETFMLAVIAATGSVVESREGPSLRIEELGDPSL
jgi:hypothetical protein